MQKVKFKDLPLHHLFEYQSRVWEKVLYKGQAGAVRLISKGTELLWIDVEPEKEVIPLVNMVKNEAN